MIIYSLLILLHCVPKERIICPHLCYLWEKTVLIYCLSRRHHIPVDAAEIVLSCRIPLGNQNPRVHFVVPAGDYESACEKSPTSQANDQLEECVT